MSPIPDLSLGVSLTREAAISPLPFCHRKTLKVSLHFAVDFMKTLQKSALNISPFPQNFTPYSSCLSHSLCSCLTSMRHCHSSSVSCYIVPVTWELMFRLEHEVISEVCSNSPFSLGEQPWNWVNENTPSPCLYIGLRSSISLMLLWRWLGSFEALFTCKVPKKSTD